MNEQRIGIVYVVDDDLSVRKASERVFRSVGFRVETFEDAQAFLEFDRPDLPCCLVLDVRMPGLSGVELQEKLIAQDPDLPIVFMTGHGDIPMTVKAIKAGAVDFLPKPVSDDRLRQAVEDAVTTHALRRQQASTSAEFRSRVDSLTSRESEVMKLVITGMLNKQIAKQLGISEATVKVHRGHVMEKLEVDSVAELVRLCERAGIS